MGLDASIRFLVPLFLKKHSQTIRTESTDGLTSLVHGSASAIAALTPFVSQQTGTTGYSLNAAVNGASKVASRQPVRTLPANLLQHEITERSTSMKLLRPALQVLILAGLMGTASVCPSTPFTSSDCNF